VSASSAEVIGLAVLGRMVFEGVDVVPVWDRLMAKNRAAPEDAGVIMADAEAVAQLRGVPIGGSHNLAIGGKGSRLDLGPVQLEVDLVSRSDGRFELEDRHSHAAGAYGVRVDMGTCAVVRHQGVTILLTSIKTPPWDLGQWRSQGINPEELSMIGVKAAVGHRVAYGKIASAEFTVNTSGPCTSDITRLPYKRLRRPVFPLDPLPIEMDA